MNTETDNSFLAGLLEGEGNISLRLNNQGYFQTRVVISNNAPEIHVWIREHFGGGLLIRKGGPLQQTYWSKYEDITRVLEATFPYLLSKKIRAAAMLLFLNRKQELTRHSSVGDEECLKATAIVSLENQKYRAIKEKEVVQ